MLATRFPAGTGVQGQVALGLPILGAVTLFAMLRQDRSNLFLKVFDFDPVQRGIRPGDGNSHTADTNDQKISNQPDSIPPTRCAHIPEAKKK